MHFLYMYVTDFICHLYKVDTCLRWTPGVGPILRFFSHFTVFKLPIRRTPLQNGQLKPVLTVFVLERVDCNPKPFVRKKN